MKLNEYVSRSYEMSKQYGLPVILISSLVDALEIKRVDRKQKEDIEKSFNTLERWLRIKKNNQ